MNIYLIDNTIDLNLEGGKKVIADDTGRTGKLRNILAQINNNSSQISVNALVQVYNQVPQNDDCGKAAFLNLTTPFILFIHTSNGCSKEFLENLFSKKNGLGSSWIACYSGGDEPDWYENLGTNSFKNIRFFKHIGDDVESKWDIPAFVSAVLDKKENAFDYLVRKPNSHLIARSQILTPFVALHLILQMEPKEQESYLKDMSKEDQKFCKEGFELMDNNGLELMRKFSELAGIPFEEGKAPSRPQKDINKFIEVYAERLYTIFQGILKNNQIELPSGDDLLAGIEQLSRLVEEEIEKSYFKKKARVIKHDLDNVMRNLDNCNSPLTPEKRGVMKNKMEMLDSIFKELNTLKETLHLDVQAEIDSASNLIRKINEGVKKNLEESRLLELRDELVGILQKPFSMIVSITAGQEKQ